MLRALYRWSREESPDGIRFVFVDHPSHIGQAHRVRADLRDLAFYSVMRAIEQKNCRRQTVILHVQANQEYEYRPRYASEPDSVQLVERRRLREGAVEEVVVVVVGSGCSWGNDLPRQLSRIGEEKWRGEEVQEHGTCFAEVHLAEMDVWNRPAGAVSAREGHQESC